MPKLNLTVKLVGEDGNVFNLMAIITREMKKHGYKNEAKEFIDEVTKCKSYDEALVVMIKWVNVV